MRAGGFQNPGGIRLVADGDFDPEPAEETGGDGGGDADEADRLARLMRGVKDAGDIGVDLELVAGERKVAEVFGGAESAGNDDRVHLVHVEAVERLDFAAGDAGGFDEDVALFARGRLAGQVIDDVLLGSVGSGADDPGIGAVEGKQHEDRFMDFGAVENAATGEEYADGFHGGDGIGAGGRRQGGGVSANWVARPAPCVRSKPAGFLQIRPIMKKFVVSLTLGSVLLGVAALAQTAGDPLTAPAGQVPAGAGAGTVQPLTPAAGTATAPAGAATLPTTELTPVAPDPAAQAAQANPTATPAPAKKEKPKAPPAPGTPFSGTISAVDKTAMTLTVEGKSKSHTLHVTSKSRFTKDGKPAMFSDAVIGEESAGYYKKAKGGDLQLVSARFGAKAATHATAHTETTHKSTSKAASTHKSGKSTKAKSKKTKPATETPAAPATDPAAAAPTTAAPAGGTTAVPAPLEPAR